ncbi:MAG: N-acetylglucosamine-6-phosphate deacetylase, partial [Myxococcaceae bacterium]
MSRPFVRGRLLLPEGLTPGTLSVEDGRIVEISRTSQASAPELEAEIVAPGFIDLQINGAFGVDVGDGGDAVRTLCGRLPSTGVTAFLPTAISSYPDEYARVFEAFKAASGAPGAVALGLHLEGPLLGRAGAHRQEVLDAVQEDWLERLLDHGGVRLMTLAPERPFAPDWIRRLRAQDVIVSLGHTACDSEIFERAVEAGATMATHLFNVMSPFGHRTPGAAGAALADDRVICGIIADGVHVHPTALKVALRTKGPDRLALVTD